MRTNFPKEKGDLAVGTKDLPNISKVFDGEIDERVKFPKKASIPQERSSTRHDL